MDCLDEDTILAFCRGDLEAQARARAESHVASCDECRALLSAVAKSSMAAPSPMDLAMAPTTPAGSGGGEASRAAGPASAPVGPGDVLGGKFEVERVLGAGGMGVVVAARHKQLDQRVALKFLLPAACEVPGAVSRFLREGKAAARITSEHVARVSDTGVLDGGAPYLVMEYLDGQDLGAVVVERGRLPASEAVHYVLQACEAIVEAHELGIVHRDLKPANLFLTKRKDGSPLVKVLDFGISKIEGGSRSDLTSASMLMGSPRYMSPEQMLSAKDVDARTDVWALGVILFELVTGKPVWEADTVQGLCARITSDPAPALRTLAPDAPAELEAVVLRCLAKKREDRIQSVADLALLLEPVAPKAALPSIERIVRVAGRAREAARSVPPSSSGAAKWLVLGVGGLLLFGLAWNVGLSGTDRAPPAANATAATTAGGAAAPASSPASASAAASLPVPASGAVAAAASAAASASAGASAAASASASSPASASAAASAPPGPTPPTARPRGPTAPPVVIEAPKPVADPGRALSDRK